MSPPGGHVARDVVEALRRDHRSLEEVLDRFESVGSGDRSEWFDRLRDTLVRHEAAEELAVYPAVRGHAAWLDRVLDDRLAEQAQTHDLIARLESVNTGTGEFRDGLVNLRQAVLDHARREERSVFEFIELEKTADERSEMGRRYERAMHGATPTPSRSGRH